MDILQIMKDRVFKRAEKRYPQPLTKFFPLSDLKSLTWIGMYAWSNQQAKSRWLDQSIVIDLFGIPQVPPEVARDYLHAKYTEKRRHTLDQFKEINVHRAAPLYALKGKYEDMALVDIRAAYWTILEIVGWDVDYYPGRWLGKRSEVDDFPLPENKIARNSLVSAGLLTPQKIWTGDKLKTIKPHNPLVNYDIWALCQDVLNGIATIAIKAGAVHIHTDGYIVPMKHAHRLIEEIRVWGLDASIKAHGDAAIGAVGAYRIGEKKTKKPIHFNPENNLKVYEPDVAWLRARMHKLSRSKIRWEIHNKTDVP